MQMNEREATGDVKRLEQLRDKKDCYMEALQDLDGAHLRLDHLHDKEMLIHRRAILSVMQRMAKEVCLIDQDIAYYEGETAVMEEDIIDERLATAHDEERCICTIGDGQRVRVTNLEEDTYVYILTARTQAPIPIEPMGYVELGFDEGTDIYCRAEPGTAARIYWTVYPAISEERPC